MPDYGLHVHSSYGLHVCWSEEKKNCTGQANLPRPARNNHPWPDQRKTNTQASVKRMPGTSARNSYHWSAVIKYLNQRQRETQSQRAMNSSGNAIVCRARRNCRVTGPSLKLRRSRDHDIVTVLRQPDYRITDYVRIRNSNGLYDYGLYLEL